MFEIRGCIPYIIVHLAVNKSDMASVSDEGSSTLPARGPTARYHSVCQSSFWYGDK